MHKPILLLKQHTRIGPLIGHMGKKCSIPFDVGTIFECIQKTHKIVLTMPMRRLPERLSICWSGGVTLCVSVCVNGSISAAIKPTIVL